MEEVIAKHKELKQYGKSISEVIAMMNGLTVSDLNNNSELNDETNQLIKLIEDFEIVENNEPNMNGDLEEVDEEGYTQDNEENIHNITNNVEGYVTSNKSFGGYVV